MSASATRGSKGIAATLTLLTRAYCHLCEDMRLALQPVAARFGARIEEIDVDSDPVLEAAYGAKVPVLLLGDFPDGRELCHYHLDKKRVEAALTQATG